MRRNRYFEIAIPAIIIITFMLFISHAVGAFNNLSEGMEIPDTTLKALDGSEVSIKSVGENQVGIIVFFATWSERSLKELSDLKELREELKDKGVSIVAVNVDHEHLTAEDLERIRSKVEELDLPFPVLIDEGLNAFRSFGVVAVPSTAIVGKGGVLKEAVNGYPTFAKMEIKDKVEILLGIKKPEKEIAEKETGYKPKREALLNYNLGRRLYGFGMLRKAERKLKKAVSVDDKFVKPLVLLGKIYLELAHKKKAYLIKAKKAFEKALEIAPDDEGAKTGYALYMVRKGNLKEAEKLVDEVISANPGYTHALVIKALVLGKKNDLKGAEKMAAEAVSLSPMDPEILALAGYALDSAKDCEKACEYYRKAGEKMGY